IRPEVWVAIERHVERCLRKDPAKRFQTMTEVKRDLEETSSGGVIVGLDLVTASGANAEAATLRRHETRSIAVLPFANLSADKENEYFSDGLAEEIMNALAKIPE